MKTKFNVHKAKLNVHKSEITAIPSDAQCRKMMAETGTLQNMVAHSLQVQRVSLFIADHLEAGGLNRELLSAGALLHDITKTRSLVTKEDHARTGEALLAEKGYPEVGRIVGQHVFLDSYLFGREPSEAEVVNYADKRVLHDSVATLTERMEYIVERYGASPERRDLIKLLWDRSLELELRLFKLLSFSPEDLARLMEENGDAAIRG
jgi:putative nucleotidyltransferase with HDIG domain